MSFQIGDIVGDYQIIELLGAGGMGKVYKVKNQISDRIDALKVLLPDLQENQELADRFIREIKVVASLNHPNIAGLRTAFRLNNQLLMLMEFVEGQSLDKVVKAGAVPMSDAVDYIRQVLAALEYAHSQGVVHRDIKPANMMLTSKKVIKLMDFGIAKSGTDQKLTHTGMIVGSLLYMSPEQVRGGALDGRSDLYSVGVALYELVTGRRPFQGAADIDIMMAQLQQIPVQPIELAPGIPQALNDVIMTSLQKDPANRYQTGEGFSAALAEAGGAGGFGSTLSRHAMGGTGSSELPVTRMQTSTAAKPPASSVPPVQAEKSSSTLKFALFAVIGAGAIATLALVFVLSNKKKEAAPSVTTPPESAAFKRLPSGDMVLVSGGDALLGPKFKQTAVKAFYIDKTEVSNQAFLKFCSATSHAAPKGSDALPGDDPAVNVTYEDARSFCGWASKRLPTANEWEKAARGSTGQPFPWGTTFDITLANLPKTADAAANGKLSSVTAYESGKSPYGALNMLGNVWEWVDAAAEPSDGLFRSYQQTDFRDLVPPLSRTEAFYNVRGGSYSVYDPNPAELISDPGAPLPARAKKPDVGFRCAMDAGN